MEIDDYEDLGFDLFPRNDRMQFREEIYWIKNVQYLVPGLQNLTSATALPDSLFRLAVPQGVQDPHGSNNNRSFWSAPISWLDVNIPAGLSSDEKRIIEECRSDGFSTEFELQECLGFDILAKLRGIPGLNFTPKNTIVYTIDVTASHPVEDISRRIVTTMNLKDIPPQGRSNVVGDVNPLVLWQRVYY